MLVAVRQVCLVLSLAVVVIYLSRFTSVVQLRDKTSVSTSVSASVSAGPILAVYNGLWYDFSHPPHLVFFVYSAFLVDDRPQDVIRLIAITSVVDQFPRRRTDVFCVVRFSDGNLTHAASILQRKPKLITEPDRLTRSGVVYGVGDYIYSCSLPEHRQHPEHVPVSIGRLYQSK